MPRPSSKTAANVPSRPQTAAEEAEKLMRKRLADDPIPVDYKTGRRKSGVKLTSLWSRAGQGDCSLRGVLLTDPCNNPKATLHQHYMGGQDFADMNPCVSAERSRAGSSIAEPTSSACTVVLQRQQDKQDGDALNLDPLYVVFHCSLRTLSTASLES